ncbi:MAG: tRNA epoxyqueuosine(34) reductase QueG [Bacteroidota bacterium]
MKKTAITQKALELGFGQCGFARCEPLEELRPFYHDFVAGKRLATLQYLERYASQRLNPELLLPGAKTVIGVTMNYAPHELIPGADNFFISRYAYGGDYHTLLRGRLEKLVDFMHGGFGEFSARIFVDSGPMLEKAWAQRCGLGWQGKNTLLIHQKNGSFFFIGMILTDLELEPDPPGTDHCGDCEKCIRACPTGALDTPYQLDIPRCISYLTIESKVEIPGELREKLNDRIYGCDICQDACPYNRHPQPHDIPEFIPSEELVKIRKTGWLMLTETDFARLFAGSPVARVGYERFMKNIRACP